MDYFEPNFVDEALVVLERYGSGAAVLAGGTLLGPRLRRDRSRAAALVNLKRIQALARAEIHDRTVRIGALMTARRLQNDPIVTAHAPLIATAAATIGAPALRSVATIGGNLLSGHHAADLATALLACDAVATVAKAQEGTIHIPVERMLSPGFGGLDQGSLLLDVRVESMAGLRHAFEKAQTRAAFELAIVSAAAVVALHEDGTVKWGRIALGGAAPTPIRAVAAETSIVGSPLHEGVVLHAAQVAANVDAEPVDDARAGAPYRRHLVEALVERALHAVARQDTER